MLTAAWQELSDALYFNRREEQLNEAHHEWQLAEIAKMTELINQETSSRQAEQEQDGDYSRATQEMYEMYGVEEVNEQWLAEDREARRRQEATQAWAAMMQRMAAKKATQSKAMVLNDVQLRKVLQSRRAELRKAQQQATAACESRTRQRTRAERARQQQRREQEKLRAAAARAAIRAATDERKRNNSVDRWLQLQRRTEEEGRLTRRCSGEVLSLTEQMARQMLGDTMLQTARAAVPGIEARNWHE